MDDALSSEILVYLTILSAFCMFCMFLSPCEFVFCSCSGFRELNENSKRFRNIVCRYRYYLLHSFNKPLHAIPSCLVAVLVVKIDCVGG